MSTKFLYVPDRLPGKFSRKRTRAEDDVRRVDPAEVVREITYWTALAPIAGLVRSSVTRTSFRRCPRQRLETLRSLTPEQARVELDRRTRPAPPEALLTSDQLAARIGVRTRQTIHDWRKRGKLVGWQRAKRGYVFPVGQLDEHEQPVPGLERVVPLLTPGYAAWVWLQTPRNSLGGATPLSLLRRGEIDRVVGAAQGDLQGDFA